MIEVISVYDDVTKDSINKWESGYASIEMFNRLSRRAELKILDWLSGDVAAQTPPEPWVTQKNKDWLSPLIAKLPVVITNGVFEKPSDYYKYDDSFSIPIKDDCDSDDEEQTIEVCDIPITVLNGDKFNKRCTTYIEDLKPSFKKPIAKIVGNTFETRPRDLGGATLEYIRYPKFAIIGKKLDPDYNNEVPDNNNSINYEWGEWARELLIFWITDLYSNHIREQALKQFNVASGKTARG